MQKEPKNVRKKLKITGLIVIAILAIVIVAVSLISVNRRIYINSPEIQRSMSYEQVQEGDEKIDSTDYVQFDAFFLRDLNADGIAEGIRGTCRNIKESDILYMELNVLTNGYLENGVITINGDNFCLQTAIPKDSEVKENAIGTDIKKIELNTINTGTQKLLTGMVKANSFDNINKYSSEQNSVTLTGTHVATDGTRTEIEKTVMFTVDWHGITTTEIPEYLAGNRNLYREQDIATAINQEEGTFTVRHIVGVQEIEKQLLLKKVFIEGEIPELNGYAPIKVEITGNNIVSNYDETTRKFTVEREAIVDENGNVITNVYDGTYLDKRYNRINVTITYPLTAYEELGSETVETKLPITAYYEGFNNANEEFENPYKSNIAKDTFVLGIKRGEDDVLAFAVEVGKNGIVSKEKPIKIYNGVSSEETDDTYIVRWSAETGKDGSGSGITMKETEDGEEQVTDVFINSSAQEISMEEITTNIGVYFTGQSGFLSNDGWIKVYDDETGNLIETFTKENWNNYTSSNPYKYELPVKHIRVETSEINASAYLTVHNVKLLDDQYITQNYTREEFDELKYIKSTLSGYREGEFVNTDRYSANYQEPYSIVDIDISKTQISTQATEKNMKLIIEAQGDTNKNELLWLNGTFLLKLPENIIDIEINSINTNNTSIKINSFEQYEENGVKFIKINTQNNTPATYDITIDCNITPDPRIETKTGTFTLYAHNENANDYKYSTNDSYDINDNLNIEEKIATVSKSISLIAPNSLLTNQIATNYDEKSSIAIAPQIALMNKEQRTADVNVQIKNNYTNTISQVVILGRIPFEGNKFAINNNDMGSNFTATMKDTGIVIPEELKDIATIYYSENGEASKDLTDTENGWTTTPTDFSKVKSYLIDLGSHKLEKGETHTFIYTISIPEGLNYNQIAYSHHGIYFDLDTDEGTYSTQTEPNKLAFMIAKEYDLELTKYQIDTDILVPGATYSITEEGQEESRTRVTNVNGVFTLAGLYIDKTYTIREIKSPKDYELNETEVKFIATEENGEIKVTLLSEEGTVRNIQAVQPQGEGVYKVQVEVEDSVKAKLKIIKTEQGTETRIGQVKFKLTGKNFENGRILTTNTNGEVTLSGLIEGEEYTLEETKVEGYYLIESPIKFTITNTDGTYTVNILEGTVKTTEVTTEENMPTANIAIENEKIPTYDLKINKVAKGETTPLAGAKFRLYKGEQELGDYITDEQGSITIPELYQYETAKNLDQTYTLKELVSPEGYVVADDITFIVGNLEGVLTMGVIEGKIKEQTSTDNTLTITIENSPSFKLIKKDGETGEVLPNTKFAIYSVNDGTEQLALDANFNILGTKEVINGKEYYTLTTNEKGEIVANLREGLYKAVEVQASDDKYEITDNEYYFGINATRETPEGYVATQATSFGGSDADYINSVAATSDGGYIAGGYFYGTIQVGNYTLTSNDDSDGMLIKYTQEGEVEWATSIGGIINSVAETSDGRYLVGGYFSSSTIQVGEYTLTNNGYSDGMLIKYTASGEVEWATSIGGSYYDYINSVAATSDGGYIAGGYFYGTIQVGNYTLTSNDESDGMLIKYTQEGEVEWATSIGGSYYDYIYSVVATSDGGFVAGGEFSRTLQVGDYTLTCNDNYSDGMIIKYTQEGEVEWAKSFGGDSYDSIESVAETSDGGYIVGGSQGYRRDVSQIYSGWKSKMVKLNGWG